METGLRILHTGNAGMLFIIGRECIGVDVFGKDPEGLYPDTPEAVKQELWRRIETGEIRTLLFTHGHGDHFCLEHVREALRRNPGLMIISTEEVVQRIRTQEPIAGKLIAVPAQRTENYSLELAEISLELFNSKHMGEQYAGVQNLVCLMKAAGRKLFIPGDAWPTPELFERVAQWSPEIDVMAAPFPLIGIPTTRRLMDKTLKIQHILAVHLPRPEKDEQNWVASAKAVCSRAKDSLPMPVFGEVLGREYYF